LIDIVSLDVYNSWKKDRQNVSDRNNNNDGDSDGNNNKKEKDIKNGGDNDI